MSGLLSSLQLEAQRPRQIGVRGLQAPIQTSRDAGLLSGAITQGIGAFGAIQDIRQKKRQEERRERQFQTQQKARDIAIEQSSINTLDKLQSLGEKAFNEGGVEGVNNMLNALQQSGIGESVRPVLEYLATNKIKVNLSGKARTKPETGKGPLGEKLIQGEDGIFRKAKGEGGMPVYSLLPVELAKTRAEEVAKAKLPIKQKGKIQEKEVGEAFNRIKENNKSISLSKKVIKALELDSPIADNQSIITLASAFNEGRPSDKDLEFLSGSKDVFNRVLSVFSRGLEGRVTDRDRSGFIQAATLYKEISQLQNNKERLFLASSDPSQLRKIVPMREDKIITTFESFDDLKQSGLEDLLLSKFKGRSILVDGKLVDIE